MCTLAGRVEKSTVDVCGRYRWNSVGPVAVPFSFNAGLVSELLREWFQTIYVCLNDLHAHGSLAC